MSCFLLLIFTDLSHSFLLLPLVFLSHSFVILALAFKAFRCPNQCKTHINKLIAIKRFGMLRQLRACADHIESQLAYQNNSKVQKEMCSLPANKTHTYIYSSCVSSRSYVSDLQPCLTIILINLF